MIERLRWIYRAWRYRLKVEKQEILWLLENLRPGDTVLDIGAHKGAFTYWMQNGVGPKGKVFAFEPQPQLAKCLRRLIKNSDFGNVVVEEKGLSSKPGELRLKIPGQGSSPSASFENTEDSTQPGHTVQVQVTTLDDYFGDNPTFRVALIKCDVEGHELEVFRGAQRLLERDRPQLLFECEARHHCEGSPKDVFSFLQSLGFRGHCVGRNGLDGIDNFDPAVDQADPNHPGYINNFVFMHADRNAG